MLNGQVPLTMVPLGVSGAVSASGAEGNYFTIGPATGNVTLSLSNFKPGQTFYVQFQQDGTGNRTLTILTSTTSPNGLSATVNPEAGSTSVLEYVFNGETGRPVLLSAAMYTTLIARNIRGENGQTLTVTPGTLDPSGATPLELANIRINLSNLRGATPNGGAITEHDASGNLMLDHQIQGAAGVPLYLRDAYPRGWRVQLTNASGLGQGFEMSTQANNMFMDFVAQNAGGGFRVFGGGAVQFQVLSNGAVQVAAAATTLGFFGGAGAAKQTGVAVTAAAIHAALVAYNLIAP